MKKDWEILLLIDAKRLNLINDCHSAATAKNYSLASKYQERLIALDELREELNQFLVD
jgi:predicted nucleic acid-binding protein